MADANDLRRYLKDRVNLGEPEIFLEPGERRRLLGELGTKGRGGTGVSDPGIEDVTDMDRLRTIAVSCTRCGLASTRQNVVFSDGSPAARVLCVGEAPGANEDRTGLPFVGRAGKLLDRLLLSVGFERRDVYICNVLKCRPPANRNPMPEEIERCSPFLLRQVDLVSPAVIVTFGTFAVRTLLDSREALGRLRGRTHLYRGVPLIATYHPAALLRNPSWTRPTWQDLQAARAIVDSARESSDA